MGARLISGGVPHDQVTRKVASKGGEVEIDWAFLDTLRANGADPQGLRDWYRELPARGKQKLHKHVVALACELERSQTLAFDIMTALLDGGFQLPKYMLADVSKSVLAYRYASDDVHSLAKKMLRDMEQSDHPESLFLPRRTGR